MATADVITTGAAPFYHLAHIDSPLLSVSAGVPLTDALWEALMLMEQASAVLSGLAAELEAPSQEHAKACAARYILESSRAIVDSVHDAMVESPKEAA